MYGQLNLFTFKPKIKFFRQTPIELNKQLWSVVKETDNRGYGFGAFNNFTVKNRLVKKNKTCATVVLYEGRKPIGFCTISLHRSVPYLDVWVMPYYRDLGFGSLLVNRANEESIKLTGKLPNGSEKHHTACWDARFRRELKKEEEEKGYRPWAKTDHNNPLTDPDNQLPMFSIIDYKKCDAKTLNRLVNILGKNTDLDYTMMKACIRQITRVT